MKAPSINLLIPLALALLCPLAAHGTIIIHDNFDNLARDSALLGRVPTTVHPSLSSAIWNAPNNALLGDGNGGLYLTYANTRSASIDLGAGYFSNNPGIYELSYTVSTPLGDSRRWVGLGFTVDNGTTSSLASGNNGSPLMVVRPSGEIDVFAGPADANKLTNNLEDPSSPTLTFSTTTTIAPEQTHVTQTYTLRLDTTGDQWAFQFLVDNQLADLGAPGETTYTFSSNPTDIRHLQFSRGGSGDNVGTATIDDFTFARVPEPSTPLLAGLCATILLLRSRRRA